MSPKACLILCAALPIYLAGDFFLFNGPLNRAIQVFSPDTPEALAKARQQGVVARVGGKSIFNSQLERATFERLWFEGKSLSTLAPDERKAARKAALDELIQDELLRSKIEAAEQKPTAPPAEIDARLEKLSAGFPSKNDLDAAAKAQGIPSEKALRDRIAARLAEEKFILSQIPVTVTDEEAKQWYDEHAKDLGYPDRVEARHIFIGTLNTPAEEGRKKIDEALAQLTAKQKDFATLAKELSEDEASKENGGSLGWLTRSRLSPDLAEPMFTQELNQPAVVRTRLGWHLLEITERKSAEPRPFEDAKPEITAALEAKKQREAIQTFREGLKKSAPKIIILDPELAG
jgi:parvulin-like peptidyl-prolyl isomerase